MKAAQVRQAFLDFFAERGHARVASSSLVPANDPTLLFTTAGMVQFKDVFTGREQRGYQRATSSQKCVRAGGKHNDLDEVGKTPRHHTFFEMLGNFSFGDYFKDDAIVWAWDLLTRVYGIDTSRLVVTVFGGDHELDLGPDSQARATWKRVTGFGDDRIIDLGKSENFWSAGDSGPCGPCSEIHYFMDGVPAAWPSRDPASWHGWLEIWNLVFMQFDRQKGVLRDLPAPSVDTGAGLERMTSVIQGVASNYDTDLFTGILATAAELAKVRYGADPATDTSLRVIADHARASTFLIADGVFPDKTTREYVLRRIFRRAVRHGKLLGITEPFMHRVCLRVVEDMRSTYPELAERASTIESVTHEEEKRFRHTLDEGLGLLEDEFTRMRAADQTTVSGKVTFTLYDTHGFPDDLTEIIAGERGFTVDKAAYSAEMDAARARSRFVSSDQTVDLLYQQLAGELPATRFLGYDGRGTSGHGAIKAIVVDGERVERAAVGAKVEVVLDQTPFYAESGGQIGDAGVLLASGGARVRVDHTHKPVGDLFVHQGEVTAGEVAVGDTVTATVDDDRRERIRANHSATHLMHLALKRVLGAHVAQKGSLVAPDRLRFDFAHFAPMTDAEQREVEDLVNADIRGNDDSLIEVLPLDEARQRGAVAMFGEKYGDQVRVVRIGHESLEFCGGTHVRRAGDIGVFKILGEAGVAQGVRRIEAVTGSGAVDYLRKLEAELTRASERLKAPLFEVADKVDRALLAYRALEKEHDKLKQKLASGGGGRDLMAETVEVGGVQVLAAAIEVDDVKVLRETGDQLRDKLGSGVVVLAGVGADKVTLVAMVTKDLIGRLHAGKIIAVAAEILGGKGGGKADLAQGGGKDLARVPEALAAVRAWVAQQAG